VASTAAERTRWDPEPPKLVTIFPASANVGSSVPSAFSPAADISKAVLPAVVPLWPPMIAHATLNATTFLVVIFIEEPKGTLPDPQPLAALAMLLVGSAVAAALMRRIRAAEPAPTA
jgi:hypothetical protein